MKLKKAKKEFMKMQSKFEKGKISQGEYEKKVNGIAAVSKDGSNFRVDTAGNWYKYVDDQWIKTDVAQKTSPQIENTFQLILYVIKKFFSNIPRLIKRFLIIGVIALIIHTYFVIFSNGGFAPNINNIFLNNSLALKGNEVMGTILWTIISFTVTSIVFKIKAMGFKKFLLVYLKGQLELFKQLVKRRSHFFLFLQLLYC